MNRTRQRPEQHNQDGSRTITVQDTNAENSTFPSTQEAPPVGVLQLRATDNTSKRVVWSEGTVDNEGMGKKKSKICCIYHKPKAFDESSDESSASDDSDSQSSDQEGSNYHSSDISDSEVNATKTLREKKGKGKAVQAHCGDDDCKANHHKQGKKKLKRTIKGTSTQTITITESSKDNIPLDGDHDPSHRTFKPNAYEKENYFSLHPDKD